MVNYTSYALLEMMAWQGLGDLVNHIREERLGLSPLTAASAPGTVVRLEIPSPESLPRSTVLGRYDSPSWCRAATHSIQETHGRQTGLRDQRSSAARDGY